MGCKCREVTAVRDIDRISLNDNTYLKTYKDIQIVEQARVIKIQKVQVEVVWAFFSLLSFLFTFSLSWRRPDID